LHGATPAVPLALRGAEPTAKRHEMQSMRDAADEAPARSAAQLTPVEARQALRANGRSVAEWARHNGFPAALVYAVLGGRRKCLRGESHRIAVALGLKALPRSKNTKGNDQ
jgi:gp16 family phage-associated protein